MIWRAALLSALAWQAPAAEMSRVPQFEIARAVSWKSVIPAHTESTLHRHDRFRTVIGIVGGAPAQPEDRGRFAQQAATTIPGVRDARITMSEPLRIDGMAGYETRIDATSGKDNTAVTVVQWLRFGGGNSLRIIGSAPRDQWAKAFPRFRAVRDGIQPRG